VHPTESAVTVVLPRADTVLGRHRAELAQSASWGVPAHVTVLYPFVPPAGIDDGVLAGLAKAVATVPAFQITLRQFGWFDDQVLWLAPEPEELFRALTTAVRQRFPDIAPYEGAYPDPVPRSAMTRRARSWSRRRGRSSHTCPSGRTSRWRPCCGDRPIRAPGTLSRSSR
jgi:hypothetical protein